MTDRTARRDSIGRQAEQLRDVMRVAHDLGARVQINYYEVEQIGLLLDTIVELGSVAAADQDPGDDPEGRLVRAQLALQATAPVIADAARRTGAGETEVAAARDAARKVDEAQEALNTLRGIVGCDRPKTKLEQGNNRDTPREPAATGPASDHGAGHRGRTANQAAYDAAAAAHGDVDRERLPAEDQTREKASALAEDAQWLLDQHAGNIGVELPRADATLIDAELHREVNSLDSIDGDGQPAAMDAIRAAYKEGDILRLEDVQARLEALGVNVTSNAINTALSRGTNRKMHFKKIRRGEYQLLEPLDPAEVGLAEAVRRLRRREGELLQITTGGEPEI